MQAIIPSSVLRPALSGSQDINCRGRQGIVRQAPAARIGATQCTASILSSVRRSFSKQLSSRDFPVRAASRSLALAVSASSGVPAGTVSVVLLAGERQRRRL